MTTPSSSQCDQTTSMQAATPLLSPSTLPSPTPQAPPAPPEQPQPPAQAMGAALVANAQPLLDALVDALVPRILEQWASQPVSHVAQNAKGRVQLELRLPYASIQEAKAGVRQDIVDLIGEIRAGVNEAHLQLAGDNE